MLNIPSDKLPVEWKDEARLDSLFAPFRSRTVNPKDWDIKVTSWKHLILLYCINNGVYCFSLSDLNKLFIRNGRPPSCLNVVFEELIKDNDLQGLDDFLKESSQTWTQWATDILVKRPILWSYNKVKQSLLTSKVNPECKYVHLEVIREESQKLLAIVPEKYTNKVVSFQEFLEVIKRDISQADNIKLLLHYLVKQHEVDMTQIKCNTGLESILIKVGHKKVIPISEVDIGIYVLEQNEKLFIKHIGELEDEITLCVKEVKLHLSKGHRQLAKTCLKKKHGIERRLTKKVNILNNIQMLQERIRDVHADANVWESYKHALSVFNTLFKETDFSEDAVENTMLQLGEVLDIQSDIQTALSKSVIEEDDQLEEELAKLLTTEGNVIQEGDTTDLEEQLTKLNINSLPDVPSSDISLKEASAY